MHSRKGAWLFLWGVEGLLVEHAFLPVFRSVKPLKIVKAPFSVRRTNYPSLLQFNAGAYTADMYSVTTKNNGEAKLFFAGSRPCYMHALVCDTCPPPPNTPLFLLSATKVGRMHDSSSFLQGNYE